MDSTVIAIAAAALGAILGYLRGYRAGYIRGYRHGETGHDPLDPREFGV